jgi:rod shape-determining protein MreD
MTIYFSITEFTRNKGYLFALGLGLTQDLIGSGIPGTNLLSKGLLSLSVEILAGRLLKVNIITQIFFFFLGTILDISIGFAIANNYLKDIPTQGFFTRQVLVMFGLNTLLGIPVIFFLNMLEYKLNLRKKPSYYADI